MSQILFISKNILDIKENFIIVNIQLPLGKMSYQF